MDSFRWGGAWSAGYGLLARRAAQQALILIGLGILAPLAMQYAIIWAVTGGVGPAGLRQGPAQAAVVALALYLRTAGWLASWRFALAENESPGRAVVYGLTAGLVALVAVVIPAALAAGAGQYVPTGLTVPAIMILGIPLLIVLSAVYSVVAAAIAVGVSLAFLLAMAIGAATGDIGLAATMVGGSGEVVVLLLVLSFATLWLAARLCCTTSLMAEGRSLNLLSAMRESWRLTWEEQWAILRYLALIGFALTILFIVLAAAAGAAVGTTLQAASATAAMTAQLVVFGLGGIPVAYLSVMATTGIYREINPALIDAEVFA